MTEHRREQRIMNTRNLAMTTAGVVTLAACSVASVTSWLLVTAPTTVAMAVQGRDVERLVQLTLRAVYDALAGLIRYL